MSDFTTTEPCPPEGTPEYWMWQADRNIDLACTTGDNTYMWQALMQTRTALRVHLRAQPAAPAAAPHGGALAGAWVLTLDDAANRAYLNVGAGRFWQALYTLETEIGGSRYDSHIALFFGHDDERHPELVISEGFDGHEADAIDARLAALTALVGAG